MEITIAQGDWLNAPDSKRHSIREPEIIRNFAAGWPAVANWSPEYFRALWPDVPVTALPTQDRWVLWGSRVDPGFKGLTMARFLDSLETDSPLYLSTPLENFGPRLLQDIREPELCRAAKWRSSRLWFGVAGLTAPLHRDHADNVYVQIVGRKEFTVFPPDQTKHLFPIPLVSKLSNARPAPGEWLPASLSGAKAYTCELHPGDALSIPHGWPHQTRSLELGIAINFWWATGFRSALARAGDVVKAMFGYA